VKSSLRKFQFVLFDRKAEIFQFNRDVSKKKFFVESSTMSPPKIISKSFL
jgi:hypothetical protein